MSPCATALLFRQNDTGRNHDDLQASLRRRISWLELGEYLDNVSEVCRALDVGWQRF
jgi:hypothetical protein